MRRRTSAPRREVGPGADYADCPDPATSNTTSNSSSDAPVATGLFRWPACASIAGPVAHAWNASSDSHWVTTKYRSSPLIGRSSWKPRKPGEFSTACARWANRFSNSGPASAGTSIALIFTTGMAQGYRADRRRRCGPRADRKGAEQPTRWRPKARKDRCMAADLLTHRGGRGEPVVLVPGLMGRGPTWSRHLPWLTQLG